MQLDGLQSQVTELHRAREEVVENPELSSEEQSLKEKLDEHSKQLEQSAKKFSQLELENLTLRDENQVPNTASNKKRCFRTKVRPMPNSGGDVTLPHMTSHRDAATCQKTKGSEWIGIRRSLLLLVLLWGIEVFFANQGIDAIYVSVTEIDGRIGGFGIPLILMSQVKEKIRKVIGSLNQERRRRRLLGRG
ncbi:hypothetical protein Bca4012_076241 [Brassica carinata]